MNDDQALTADEAARAAEFAVFWIVWYQDRFSREDPAYPHDVFLTEAEARAGAAAMTSALGPGSFERYDVTGPHRLTDHSRNPAEFRHLLRLLEARAR